MTNHEAIQFLSNMIGEEHGRSIGADGFYRELCAYHVDALKIAIKALEQEPMDKSAMMYEIYMKGVNMSGEYQGCWVRFKDIETIVNKYMEG